MLLSPVDLDTPANPARLPIALPSAPMPTSSSLTEQLAALGMQLPVWPEEQDG
jgi:hypothetical protein